MKTCSKCKIKKLISEFYLDKRHKDGLTSWCKDCDKFQLKLSYKNHKAKRRIFAQQYYQKNKNKIINDAKQYYKYNKNKIITRKQNRYKNEIVVKLTCNLRNRLNQAIKNNYKSGSAVRDLGCSIDFLKKYIEKKFLPGMTWDNYGKGLDKWNIDHIIPLDSFDLTNRKQLLKAVHYTNLQPLWELDNLSKGSKINYE